MLILWQNWVLKLILNDTNFNKTSVELIQLFFFDDWRIFRVYGGLFFKGFMVFLTNLYPMNLQKIEIQENMPNKF